MQVQLNWHTEFARVVGYTRCSVAADRNLLRDANENVPQPGYIGSKYDTARVLLVGQNPGTPKSLTAQDIPYTSALRAIRDEPTPERYAQLTVALNDFIPQWPVHGNYFPLAECGLTLQQIAYCNIVRCRTSGDKAPNSRVVGQCTDEHFSRWLRILAPRVVVFIGKWASERGAGIVTAARIPHAFMNRQRSLASAERITNRAAVVSLVRQYRG